MGEVVKCGRFIVLDRASLWVYNQALFKAGTHACAACYGILDENIDQPGIVSPRNDRPLPAIDYLGQPRGSLSLRLMEPADRKSGQL